MAYQTRANKLFSSVPVPDPRKRTKDRKLKVDEIPSVLRAPDFMPVELPMRQVSDTHFVREEAGV
jgi:hypothetical protein